MDTNTPFWVLLLALSQGAAAQSVARRSVEMANKVDLEVMGVIENMSGFTTPSGEKFSIFGEGRNAGQPGPGGCGWGCP